MTVDLDRVFTVSVWGQIAKGGKFHAFRQAWWDEEQWVPACNRHATYTDMQLHSLDSAPGRPVCNQAGCAMAYTAWCRAYRDNRP